MTAVLGVRLTIKPLIGFVRRSHFHEKTGAPPFATCAPPESGTAARSTRQSPPVTLSPIVYADPIALPLVPAHQ